MRPLWGQPQVVGVAAETGGHAGGGVEAEAGGHAGGDVRLLEDLFGAERRADPLGRAASHVDGALAVLTGIAANRSFATGQPVDVSDLVRF